MNNQKLYQIGLTMINGIGDILSRQLLESAGSPEAIFSEKPALLEKIPGIGRTLASEIKRPEVLRRAEKELFFIEKNGIAAVFLTDGSYPARLKECPDSPVLFYVKGCPDLASKYVLSIVGTRNATSYGRECTDHLIRELSQALPDLLVVSGLAYGVDIYAYRTSLNYHVSTVAVLAHGLDRIYPQVHRAVAVDMLERGGLLTEFPSETNPDKPNFVKRNWIVAGLSDATVVVESAHRGGSLITVDIAFSYGRDVFAFPGKTTDPQSQGCNQLIRKNKAALITCAEELITAMCWDINRKKETVVQGQLFFQGDGNSNRVMQLLHSHGELHINVLVQELQLPVYELSGILFELEMGGHIKALPGNMYRLLVLGS
ncbi:MAG: DNA-processing protein DprA [Tannerellaceae bacterium]|nr:DNA-processing protein DprA [Tannerellaceae bacterium]